MIGWSIFLWLLIGVVVVSFLENEYRRYGGVRTWSSGNVVVVLGAIIVWPLAIFTIRSFKEKQEKIIDQVIETNPGRTREDIFRDIDFMRKIRKGDTRWVDEAINESVNRFNEDHPKFAQGNASLDDILKETEELLKDSGKKTK